VDAERAEKSLRSYIKAMGRAAFARAVETGDVEGIDDDDEASDLDQVAGEYWESDYRGLLLTAYYLIDESIQGEMHDLLEHAGGLFRKIFTAAPDVSGDEADDEYLAAYTIFDGSDDHPGPCTPEGNVEARASEDGIDELLA
jgi:hypothetical protein